MAFQPHPAAELPAIIPREVLFGNPDRLSVQISPDGRYLSYCAPHDGVMNVWVAPIDDVAKARVVTRDTKRGIREYHWAYTSGHVLYRQDEGGGLPVGQGLDHLLHELRVLLGGPGGPRALVEYDQRGGGQSRVPRDTPVGCGENVAALHALGESLVLELLKL